MLAKKFASGILCVVLQVALTDGMITAAATDTLQLRVPSHEPITLTAGDVKVLPHITVTIHNSHTDTDETYAGVRVADLFAKEKLGAPLGAELHGKALSGYLVANGSDGYHAVLALAEIDPSFHPGEVLVADAMNSHSLDAHSGRFKLVVTEDRRRARSVRNLVSLELKMAD